MMIVGDDIQMLRLEFMRLLTHDSETRDRRRREYNHAIFNADEGWAVYTDTDLDMVMDKFDKAVRNIQRQRAITKEFDLGGGPLGDADIQAMTDIIANLGAARTKRPHRHRWVITAMLDIACQSCGALKDEAKSRRGKTAHGPRGE